MDEREKLRKFRELDDAFAAALQNLDKPMPGTQVANAYEHPEKRFSQHENERHRIFEQRLTELMDEYQLASDSVSALLQTLLKLKKIS
ncbi:hypothetical protein FGL86_12030 [Pistricoccus aurantiacus]|uniref:Uncharacterized protein n=1 Tax=Pistricoccus aurantiacus TaxID=1883414 RepID=A0A5B8SSP7_9GAMM|nr:hypothetical protein [Pistricoccus aurantiacus]QEA39726.1 hypothetical protein FGL86_12030 [Pistricoccus aurantiacus]